MAFVESLAFVGILVPVLGLVALVLLNVRMAKFERLARDQGDQNERNQQAILRLLDEMGSLADGDLTVEATVTEDITGTIADSFNFAIEELRKLVATVNETAIMVDSAAKQTESTASHMAKAADNQGREINAATESIVSMAASIEEVSGEEPEEALPTADVAETDLAVTVADDTQGRKAENPATLDHLGHTVDGYQFLEQAVACVFVHIRHVFYLLLEAQSAFTRSVRQFLHPAVILVTGTIESHFLDAGLNSPLGYGLAYSRSSGLVRRALEISLDVLLQGRSGRQHVAILRADDLRVNVARRAVNRQTIHFQFLDLRAALSSAAQAVLFLVQLHNDQLSNYFFFASFNTTRSSE